MRTPSLLLLLGNLLASHFLWAQSKLDWQPREDLNLLLPASVKIFETNDTLPDGTPIIAQYAAIDLSDQNLELKAVGEAEVLSRTTQDFYEEYDAILAINGGFFSSSTSVSLIVNDGNKIAPNVKTVSRNDTTYYPTRGAFGLINRQPDVAWVYDVAGVINGIDLTYQYPEPADNSVERAPLPQPDMNFPEGGTVWPVSQAMGGLPVLVHEGQLRVTIEEELNDNPGFTGPNPRTAIGYREDGTIIMVIIEGRQLGSSGTTLQQTAEIMLDLGTVEAVNLDGGGSSTMVAADEIVNIPVNITGGDRNNIRQVGSAWVLTEKNPTEQEEVVILDTDSENYSEFGLWSDSKGANFYGASAARSTIANEDGFKATYQLNDIEEARYQLSAWWTVDTDQNAANVPYVIHYNGQTDTVAVDQNDLTTRGRWNVLGEYPLGPEDYVEILNQADGERVIVDALRLVKLSDLKSEIFRGDVRLSFVNDINASFGTVGYAPTVDSAVARLAREYRPDIVYGIGDLVAGQSSSLSDERVREMWQGFKSDVYEPLLSAGIEFGFTFGNHDASLEMDRRIAEEFWTDPENKPDLNYVDDTNYPFYYSFTAQDGKLFFASLDAGGAQFTDATVRDWLRETLSSSEAQNAQFRFVGGHLPVYGVSEGRDTPGNTMNLPDTLLSIFQEYDVHTYLSGHHAAFYPGKRGGIDFFTGGEMGAGRRQYLGTDQLAPYTLTLMDIFYEEDTIIYTTFDIGEPENPTWPEVAYSELPEAIFGINGYVLRRDIDLLPQGTTQMSPINRPQGRSSPAQGSAEIMVMNGELTVSGRFDSLQEKLLQAPDAIGLYQGRNTEEGELLYPLEFDTETGRSGSFSGSFPVDPSVIERIAVGALFIELKTTAYPEGELRGQLYQPGNMAPPAVTIASQQPRNTYAVRKVGALYEINWEAPDNQEGDPLSYVYQLAYDSAFEEVIREIGTGRVTNVKLLEEELYMALGDTEEYEPRTLYQRVIVTDGSNITYSPAQAFNLMKSDAPLDDLVEVPAPNYVLNDIILSEGFGGTGVAIDGYGKIWTSTFSQGIRVYNPDGTEADISPIPFMVLENGDTLRTVEGEAWSTRFGYGMSSDPEGNVLMGKGGKVAKFNALTGRVLTHWDAPFTILSPETDTLGFVYVAGLFTGNNIVFKLGVSEIDPTLYEVVQEIDVTGRPFTREFAASPDGLELYFPSNGTPEIVTFISRDGGASYQTGEVITSIAAGSDALEVPQDSVLYSVVRPGSNLPTTLHYRNENENLLWTLELPELPDDNRGMAVTTGGDTIVVSGWSDGTFRRYVLQEDDFEPLVEIDQYYTVSEVRSTNAEGEADSLGVYAAVEGVVNSINYTHSGLNFFMDDGELGINVYSYTDTLAYHPEVGDKLAVFGEIQQDFGLNRLQADSLRLLQRGAAYKMPTLVDGMLYDSLESTLVRLENVSLTDPSQWTTREGYRGFMAAVTDGEQTYEVFISSESELYRTNPPQGVFNLTGVVSQLDRDRPYDEGYQIWPRAKEDLEVIGDYAVLSFTLVDAATNEDLQALRDGDVIDLRTSGDQLNLRANTDPRLVNRVVFSLNGQPYASERSFPYALAGDEPQGDYKPWLLDTGVYELTATPYVQLSDREVAGQSLTVKFEIIRTLGTIVDVAQATDELSTLVEALSRANLASVLADPNAQFTVFAPVNQTFTALGTNLDSISAEQLGSILQYHVIPGRLLAEDLTGFTVLGTLQQDSLSVHQDGDQLLINGAAVLAADILADNGVVHLIDQVLQPTDVMAAARQHEVLANEAGVGSLPEQITAFPVPLKDIVTIRLAKPLQQEAKFSILDVRGATRISDQVPAGIQQFRVNVATLSKGFYTLRLVQQYQVMTYRLIKE